MTVEELYKFAKERGIEKRSIYIDIYQEKEVDYTTQKITPEMVTTDSGRTLIEIII